MSFIAKTEVGGAEGYEWKVAGEAGAIEMPDHVAFYLTSKFPKMFFLVEKAAKKVEDEVKKVEEAVVDAIEAVEEKVTKKRAPAAKE
jgi:hypothetical protein